MTVKVLIQKWYLQQHRLQCLWDRVKETGQ